MHARISAAGIDYRWLQYSVSSIDSQSARGVGDRREIRFSDGFDRGRVKSGLRTTYLSGFLIPRHGIKDKKTILTEVLFPSYMCAQEESCAQRSCREDT